MEFANMSGLDALDEIFDTADARAVGAASEEPVADVDMADVVTAHGDFECALRDRPEEDPALWRLVDGDGQLWRCGSRCRHKNCMQRLAAFHYDWLCTTARKAERLMAATKAQDLVNMDRKHGGGQARLLPSRKQLSTKVPGRFYSTLHFRYRIHLYGRRVHSCFTWPK